jgi:hypothetical protein
VEDTPEIPIRSIPMGLARIHGKAKANNIRVRRFPDVFIANMPRLQHRDLFKASAEDRQDVEVKPA